MTQGKATRTAAAAATAAVSRGVCRLPQSMLLAARQHYRAHGYALLPGAVDEQTVRQLRAGALAAALARRAHFADWPTLEAVLKARAQWADPLGSKLFTQLEQRQRIVAHVRGVRRRRRRLLRAMRTVLRGRRPTELSGDELWRLSELVAAAAETPTGACCTATVASDAQMLRAINACAVNAWMTNSLLKELLLPPPPPPRPSSSSTAASSSRSQRRTQGNKDNDDNDNDEDSDVDDDGEANAVDDVTRRGRALRAALAQAAEYVGGVAHPVVFADAPLLREAYGSGVGYHCTAPHIGVRTNSTWQSRHGKPHDKGHDSNSSSATTRDDDDSTAASATALAVTLIVFTYTPSETLLPPYVLRNSHTHVRAQYIHRVRPTTLVPHFRPLESHMPHHVKQFCLGEGVVGTPLLRSSSADDGDGNDSDGDDGGAVISPGTVMVVDPHLLVGFGHNLTCQDEVVYRLHVVRRDAVPYMRAPSWVRQWRMSPRDVSFAAAAVFPPLTDEA